MDKLDKLDKLVKPIIKVYKKRLKFPTIYIYQLIKTINNMTKTTTNQSKGKSTTTTTRSTRRNLYKEANGNLNRAVDVGLDKMENILRLMKEYKKNKQLINNPPTRTTKVYEENARVIKNVSLLSNELTKSVIEIKQCLRILYIILGDKGLNKRTLLLDIPKKYFNDFFIIESSLIKCELYLYNVERYDSYEKIIKFVGLLKCMEPFYEKGDSKL